VRNRFLIPHYTGSNRYRVRLISPWLNQQLSNGAAAYVSNGLADARRMFEQSRGALGASFLSSLVRCGQLIDADSETLTALSVVGVIAFGLSGGNSCGVTASLSNSDLCLTSAR
jgi:hypothetical protein